LSLQQRFHQEWNTSRPSYRGSYYCCWFKGRFI